MLLVATVACVAAAIWGSDWPYGFFTLLRLLVTTAGLMTIVSAPTERLRAHRVPLVVLTLLFNPIVPVRLSGDDWIPIDLAAGLYLLIVCATVWRKPKKTREDTPTPRPEAASAFVDAGIKAAIADWKRKREKRSKRGEDYFRNDPRRAGGLICLRCGARVVTRGEELWDHALSCYPDVPGPILKRALD